MPRMQRTSDEGPLFVEHEVIGNWPVGRIYPTPKQVPSGWKLSRLTAVARLESGHTPSRRVPQYWDGGVPWISLHDTDALGSNEILVTAMTISQAGLENSSARLLPKGTVVFSRTATVGKTTIMGREMATSQDFANYVCGTELDNKYLVYLFRFMQREWQRLMAGSTHNSIYMPVFQELAILLPPIGEQRMLAEALSDADALIESLEQLLVKKRQIKQGAMQELLTGKKRLPGFTSKWEVKTLGDLFHISGGLSASRDQLSSEGVYYLHYGDIHLSTKTFVDVRTDGVEIPKLEIKVGMVSPKSLLADGDIVFVDASEDDEGTSRHVVIFNEDGIPFISGLHTIVAKSKTGELDRGYKRYCFQTSAVKSQFKFFAVGTKVSGISKTNIAKVKIPVPVVVEQAAIATILVAMDAEIAALDGKLAKARQLKQGMMQELLTGRIRLARPSAQVLSFPVKESASVTDISHNTHFNEAVVIAVLSAKFGSETFPLGRFRRTKYSYLLHRHAEHEAAGFMKKAAGPYNPRTRYGGAEKIALQNRYVRVLSTGKSEGFVADENIAQAEGYFEKWYGAEALTWLEQFRYQKNDALELLTTVDMACEDLSRVGKAATLFPVKQIIQDSPEWKAKLNRAVFSDDNIATTIQSCGQLFPIEEE